MKAIKDTPGREEEPKKSKITFGEREISKVGAIEYCEKHYPNTCIEFKRIQTEQYKTFCKKQKNYGPSNISVGTNLETETDVKLSLTGIWFRINDKVQRLKQLVVMGHEDEVGESIEDTLQDLSIYGIIARIVSSKKWGK